jgi:hypothetical protein
MSKLAKENQILVVRKEPGKEAAVEPLFENTLEAFQEAVGGYIETVTFSQDLILICNEEGRIMGLPHNCTIGGIDFCGTILAVGSSGDEFASLNAALIPKVMGMLK